MHVEDVLKASTLYEALGVLPSATMTEIRACYKKCALQFHPDKNADPRAHQAFIRISEAFSVLKDMQQRIAYGPRLPSPPTSSSRSPSPPPPPFQPTSKLSHFHSDVPSTASSRQPQFGRRANDRCSVTSLTRKKYCVAVVQH